MRSLAFLLFRYFSIEMTTSNTDLSVATNPIYGDPDIYVSPLDPEGRMLPSKHNYTWHSLNFGSDTLEIQAREFSFFFPPDVGRKPLRSLRKQTISPYAKSPCFIFFLHYHLIPMKSFSNIYI